LNIQGDEMEILKNNDAVERLLKLHKTLGARILIEKKLKNCLTLGGKLS